MNGRRAGFQTKTLVLCLFLAARQSHAESLTEVLADAYNANPRIAGERSNLRATDENVAQAIAGFLPTVKASAQSGAVDDNVAGGTPQQDEIYRSQVPNKSYGVTLNQNLYRGGRSLAEFDAALGEVRAEAARMASTEQTVFVQAATDYADFAEDEEAVELARNDVDTLTAEANAVRARFKLGSASRTDVAQAEASTFDAEAQVTAALTKLATSQLAFQRDVGHPPIGTPSLEFPLLLPKTLELAEQFAADNNPDVLTAEYNTQVAKADLADTRGKGRPTVSLELSLRHQYGGAFSHESEQIGSGFVQFDMPLYDGGRTASEARQGKDTIRQKIDAEDQAKNDALYTARAAWAQLQLARKAQEARVQQAVAAETALTGTRKQQIAGELTETDVLAAIHTLYTARFNALQAKHDAFVAACTIRSAGGLLTVAALNLPVDAPDNEKRIRQLVGAIPFLYKTPQQRVTASELTAGMLAPLAAIAPQ